MQVELLRGDESLGVVVFNEDTGAVTADMHDPNDQAQVESVIEAAEPYVATGRFVGSGEMEKISHDSDETWLELQILKKLRSLGYTDRSSEDV
jgi:hypothetical protein